MIRSLASRCTAGVIGVVLTLATSAPAAARPNDVDSAGGAPAGAGQTQAGIAQVAASQSAGGVGAGWEYAAIASGGAWLALIGTGGTRAVTRRRRRRQDAAAHPTGAA